MTNEWININEALPPAPGAYEIKAEVWRLGRMINTLTENRNFDGEQFDLSSMEEAGEEHHNITHWRAL